MKIAHQEESLSEAQIRSGLRANIVAGSLGMVWVAVAMGIPLTMFLEALGATGVQIGLAVTVQQVAMIVQIPSALLAGRLKTRKRLWAIACLTHRSLWFLPVVLPLWLYDRPDQLVIWVIGIVAASSLLMHVSAASWWSWMADVVPENRRGRFWGLRQSVVTAAHMVAVWLAGFLLDLDMGANVYIEFQVVFLIGALFGVLDILIHMVVPEPKPTPLPSFGIIKAIKAPFANADFGWLTLSMGWWVLGVSMVGQYSFLYLRRDFDISYSDLALTAVSASLGVAVFGVIWGYVVDRLGARAFALVTMALAPCFGVAWFLMQPGDVTLSFLGLSAVMPQPVLVLVVANFFAGAVYSGVGLAQVGLLATAAPPEGRTIAMAVHWSGIGIMSAVGPVVAGALMDYVSNSTLQITLPMGATFAFMHVLVILHALITWVLAVPCLLRLRHRPGDVSVRTAAARMFPINPMRAIGSIIDIYALSSSSSSQRVARAVRRVGENRSAIAVQDLIERADDPDADVREQAIQALGRLDAPEATDELIRRMNDPNSDALPSIARALRDTRDPRSVQSLVARLCDADRETVAEAARALGQIGDRTAANALLRLLRGSTDAKILTAAGEALSRLGEFAAAREIVLHMLKTENTVQRASMAISVANLMGEPGAFYKYWSIERRDRGTGMTAIMNDFRAMLKRSPTKSSSHAVRGLVAASESCLSDYTKEARMGVLQHLTKMATELSALRATRNREDAASSEVDAAHYNERLGLGVWYIGLLSGKAPSASPSDLRDLDLMLGGYLLAAFEWDRGRTKSSAPDSE